MVCKVLNRWFINKVEELYTVYNTDIEDKDKDESKDEELAQPLPDFSGRLVTLVSFGLRCVTNCDQPIWRQLQLVHFLHSII